MVLEQLSLLNFRNFKKRDFEFSPGATIIVGPNTSGKTNILEAVSMLATGGSFRANLEGEVISWGEEVARIQGVTQRHEGKESTELEILITTGSVGGKKVPKKKFLVNKVKKRLTDFLGNFFAVLFSPQDLPLVTDSPSLRRKYLNSVLSGVDKEYQRALLVYEKALRQRNRILEKIREGRANVSQLEYWDRLLIENGGVIIKKREELIGFFNRRSSHKRFRDDFSQLDKRPPAQLTKNIFWGFKMSYQKNEISAARLKDGQEKEVVLGMTLVGPHRDDFVIKLVARGSWLVAEGKDLSIYGSRGEQRLAILWLKLGELFFLEEKTGKKPVLLLDDIFSELDQEHRRLVVKTMPYYQTIITTTEEKMVEKKFLRKAKVIKL